jgi:HlyD family secretion protein
MEIFLPSNRAAAVKVGSEARFKVDYEPDKVARGYVSFVSPEAQFTPKEVETRSEREKLMFRVKIQVPKEFVQHYIDRIKTGVRGVGYVMTRDDAKWPAWLDRNVVNPGPLEPESDTPAPNLPQSSR